MCEGWLEGYLLTGRHGFFNSYEAFIRIVDSMFAQHAKWLKTCNELPRGGYLATCSCSHFASEALFIKMLRDAARDAGVQLRQIEARQQCADHPILWGVEETNYLKFFIFQVV